MAPHLGRVSLPNQFTREKLSSTPHIRLCIETSFTVNLEERKGVFVSPPPQIPTVSGSKRPGCWCQAGGSWGRQRPWAWARRLSCSCAASGEGCRDVRVSASSHSRARAHCLASRPTGSSGGGPTRAIRRLRGWGWGSQVEADGQDTREVLKGQWAHPLSVCFLRVWMHSVHVKHKGKDSKRSRAGGRCWVISKGPTLILAPRGCPPTGKAQGGARGQGG